VFVLVVDWMLSKASGVLYFGLRNIQSFHSASVQLD